MVKITAHKFSATKNALQKIIPKCIKGFYLIKFENNPMGLRFLTESRMFTEEELKDLSPLKVIED